MPEKIFFKNAIEIGNEIYVYKNFLSLKELKECEIILNDAKESDWIDGAQFQKPTIETCAKKEFGKILKKIQKEILPEGYYLEDTPGVNRMRLGFGMEEHSDDCPHCKKINGIDENVSDHLMKRCVLYGIVVYLTEFTGGEIYYPVQNVIFKPEPGDMIIHSTSKECKHGVKPVLSGQRCVLSPYIIKYNDIKYEKDAKEFWKNYQYEF